MPAARLCCAQSRGGISATSRSDCAPAARSTLLQVTADDDVRPMGVYGTDVTLIPCVCLSPAPMPCSFLAHGSGTGHACARKEQGMGAGDRHTHGMSVTSVPYTPMGRTSSSAVTWKSTGSSYLGVGECRACSRGAVAAGGGADTSARLCTAKVSCRHGRGSSKLAWYRYKLPKELSFKLLLQSTP